MRSAIKILFSFTLLAAAICRTEAQTAVSLYWNSDGKQVKEVATEKSDLYEELGHHGPAVENTHMALRLYFNDSGAIDVYSKTGRGLELEHFRWYPTPEQMEQGAGADVYDVGETLGLGGVALWDGRQIVRPVATKGRTARVGETKSGSFAEILSYGVPCGKDTLNISVRIDMSRKSRVATVTARELDGKDVMFVTGLNYHPGLVVKCADGYMYTWGCHPSDVTGRKVQVGAGLFYNPSEFGPVEVRPDMLCIVSRPSDSMTTRIVASSTLEAELNSEKRLGTFMSR